MRFAIPSILWLLFLVPLVGAGLVWAAGHRRNLLGRFGSHQALSKRGISAIGALTWVRMAMFVLGTASLIIALARPQWGYHERQVVTRGVDMMIAIDTSASMMARDFPPNRLSRAKDLLKNLIWEAHGDRVGIVAFAGSAAVMCPLTLDYNMASTALKAVDVNTVSARGTNIGAAIKAANGAFEISGSNDRVLVLLTDGEQMEQTDELNTAVKKAADEGVKIFAIGLGTASGSNIPTLRGPLRDSSGKIVRTSLDFDTLKKTASTTNGEAIKADKIGAGEIAQISSALAKYRGHKQQDKTFRVYHERYPWFVGAALLLFVLEALSAGFRGFGRKRGRSRTGVGTALFVCGLALAARQATAYPGEDYVKSRDALQKYKTGDFDQSVSLYQKAADLKPQDSDILYNLGAAAAKAGKVDEARKALGKVYNPDNSALNANARYGVATLDHRAIRKEIVKNKKKWAEGLAKGDDAASKDVNAAIDKLKKVIGEYKQTILERPDDMDMKINYELAKNDLKELEDLLKKNQKKEQKQKQQNQKNDDKKQDQKNQGDKKNQGGDKDQKGQQGKDKKDQKQNQNPNDQKNKPDENKGDKQDKQNKNDGDKNKDQKGKDKPGETGQNKPGNEQGQENKPNPKGTPAPTPTPSPNGTPKPGDEKGEGGKASEQGQPVPVGQMSPTDVDRLLNTLPPEDQQALQLMMGTPTQQPDMKNGW